jgi:hypothetical protein
MIRKPDPELVTAPRKLQDAVREQDLAAAAEYKQWLDTLDKVDLRATLHTDQGDVEKTLKKAGVQFSTRELQSLSPLARAQRKQELVIFTYKGKAVGYSVGATPLNT